MVARRGLKVLSIWRRDVFVVTLATACQREILNKHIECSSVVGVTPHVPCSLNGLFRLFQRLQILQPTQLLQILTCSINGSIGRLHFSTVPQERPNTKEMDAEDVVKIKEEGWQEEAADISASTRLDKDFAAPETAASHTDPTTRQSAQDNMPHVALNSDDPFTTPLPDLASSHNQSADPPPTNNKPSSLAEFAINMTNQLSGMPKIALPNNAPKSPYITTENGDVVYQKLTILPPCLCETQGINLALDKSTNPWINGLKRVL